MKKRLLSMILALSMMLTILPVNAITAWAADDTTLNGKTYVCGKTSLNTVTATLTENVDTPDTYTLTISGEGEMRDYNYYFSATWTAPWYRDCGDKITKVVIGEGVTSIGNNAFQSLKNLTDVSISSTIKLIGEEAFYNCSKLSNVSGDLIPNGVTSIGSAAFSGCSSLTGTLGIPSSVISIGSSAFYGCSGFTGELNIPTAVTGIESTTFDGCSGLTSVVLPASVTSIGERAFENCRGLTRINIPDAVTSIEKGTFSGCSSLTSIDIHNVASIGKSAFASTGLTSVEIPSGVTSISESAFSVCKSLTSVTIPNTVTSIGKNAFSYSGLTSISIPNSVTSIGESAFAECTSLSGTLTIPNSVTSLGRNAFYNCYSLTGTLEIPSSVGEIGENTFCGCSGLTGATISDGVTSIGSSAFSSCRGLTSITIPGSVTTIGSSAFSSCSNLTSVTIPDGVTSIGNSAFSWCTSLQKVYLPETVPSIGSGAFDDTDVGVFYYPDYGTKWKEQTNVINGTISGLASNKTTISIKRRPSAFNHENIAIHYYLDVPFDANDGAFADGSTQKQLIKTRNAESLTKDQIDSIEKPTKAGMVCIGWSTNQNATTSSTYDRVYDNTVFYAVYRNAVTATVKIGNSTKRLKAGTNSDSFGVTVAVNDSTEAAKAKFEFANGTVQYKETNGEWTEVPADGVEIANLSNMLFQIATSKDATVGTTSLTVKLVTEQGTEMGVNAKADFTVTARTPATIAITEPANKNVKAGEPSQTFTMNITNHDDEVGNVTFNFDGEVQYADNTYGPNWTTVTSSVSRAIATSKYFRVVPKADAAAGDMTLTAKLVDTDGNEITGATASTTFNVAARENATVTIGEINNGDELMKGNSYEFTVTVNPKDDQEAGKTGKLTFDDTTGLKYWDGSKWADIPTGGVSVDMSKEHIEQKFQLTPSTTGNNQTLTATLTKADNSIVTDSTTYSVRDRQCATVTINGPADKNIKVGRLSKFFGIKIDPKDDTVGSVRFSFDGEVLYATDRNGIMTDVNGNIASTIAEKSYFWVKSSNVGSKILTVQLVDTNGNDITGASDSVVLNVTDLIHATVTIGDDLKNQTIKQNEPCNFTVNVALKDDASSYVTLTFNNVDGLTYEGNPVTNEGVKFYLSRSLQILNFTLTPSETGSKTLKATLNNGANDSATYTVSEYVHANVAIDGLGDDLKQGESKDFTVKVDPKDDSGKATIDFGDKNSEIQYKDPADNQWKDMPNGGLDIDLSNGEKTYDFRITPKNDGDNQKLTAAVKKDGNELGKDEKTYNVSEYVDAVVKIDGLSGTVETDTEKEFTVTVTANDDAGKSMTAKAGFTGPANGVKKLEIDYTGNGDWQDVTQYVGNLYLNTDNLQNISYNLRVTFAEAGEYKFDVSLTKDGATTAFTSDNATVTVTKKAEPVVPGGGDKPGTGENPGGGETGGGDKPGTGENPGGGETGGGDKPGTGENPGDGGNTNPGGDGGNTNPGGDGGNTNPGGDGGNTNPGGDSGNTGDKEPETKSYELTVIGGSFTAKQGENALTVETTKADNSLTAKIPEGAVVTVTLNKDAVPEGMVFDQWKINDDDLMGNPDVAYDQETFHFTMPEHDVKVEVMYRDATIESDGPGILGTGAMIATVGISAAALAYQGHMLGTEFALRCMLPEWALIPQNRAELAVLLWSDAEGPEPVSTNLYSDISEDDSAVQKAARWAVENDLMELLDAEEAPENFDPFVPVTYLDSIHAWKKAQELKK